MPRSIIDQVNKCVCLFEMNLDVRIFKKKNSILKLFFVNQFLYFKSLFEKSPNEEKKIMLFELNNSLYDFYHEIDSGDSSSNWMRLNELITNFEINYSNIAF
jgi:hypothetical protein